MFISYTVKKMTRKGDFYYLLETMYVADWWDFHFIYFLAPQIAVREVIEDTQKEDES